MMKLKYLIVVMLVSVFGILAVSDFAAAQSAPELKVTLSKKSFKPGESGKIIIKFKHGPQVKIPKEPPIEVEISGDGISGQGVQDYSGGEGDYISNSQIKYNFSVSQNAQSGTTITITGKVKFGYCSTESGICKIGNKNFTVTVKVK
jgi:hypothetical protein